MKQNNVALSSNKFYKTQPMRLCARTKMACGLVSLSTVHTGALFRSLSLEDVVSGVVPLILLVWTED
jgi:hypothetical protein